MHKHLHYLLFIFFCGIIISSCSRVNNVVSAAYVCPANRFTTEQFTIVTSTVTYTQATDYQGINKTLNMDINLPAADTLAHRPVIIYCHGGGFTTGTRNSAWPNKFCQAFAKRGYVTASIDYRLGIGAQGDADVISAQVRAVQDAKAAVRYFKQTAMEQGNPYRIDTAQIYIAGESAGAIIALQMGYLKSAADFALVGDNKTLSDLNGIEGNSSSSYSSKIAGVISLSGAMLNLNWLNNSSLPVIMVHGTNDNIIPYKKAVVSPYTATPLYGSYLIDSACVNLKVTSNLYTFKGAGTAPYITSTQYADSTIKYVAQQLYGLIDCQRLGRR